MAITRNNISLNTHEAITPQAYDLSSVVMTMHNGQEYDITSMVDEVTVTESIYRMALTSTFRLYDANNFFEDKQVSGQEKIVATWHRTAVNELDNVRIEKTFYVADIPVYSRVQDHSQVYQFDCITRLGFVNNTKLISRSFSGTPATIVKDIIENDLGYKDEVAFVSNNTSNIIRVIIPNWRPFNAIQWVLRNAVDNRGSSFYCYETFTEGVKILSYHEMLEAENYRTYSHGTFFNSDPHTSEDYDERRDRILEINSDMYMSKYNNVRLGAYASTTLSIDMTTKTYRRHRFNYVDEFSEMYHVDHREVHPNISRGFTLNDQTLDQQETAKMNFISNNALAYGGEFNNYHAGRETNIGRHTAFEMNMDNFVHDVKIAGDYEIQPGVMIGLKIPKAVDPESRPNDNVDEDKHVSGDYLVTSVVHTFGDEYICDMRCKKDVMSVELSEGSTT